MRLEQWLSELTDVKSRGESPHNPLLLTVPKTTKSGGELREVFLPSPELAYQLRHFALLQVDSRKRKLNIQRTSYCQ